MAENSADTVKIECPSCGKEYGVSMNAFDAVEQVTFNCPCGYTLTVTLRGGKELNIKASY